MLPRAIAVLITRDEMAPISYFIREGLSRPSLQMMTIMKHHLSTFTSHVLFLSGPPKQIPEGSDMLDILWLHWASREQNGWAKSSSEKMQRIHCVAICSDSPFGKWGSKPPSVFHTETAMLREWSVYGVLKLKRYQVGGLRGKWKVFFLCALAANEIRKRNRTYPVLTQ